MPSQYYLAHQEELKAKMRENDAKRRAKLREEIEKNPSLIERERERMRAKYYRANETKVKRALDECLEDTNISPVFQRYIREVLLKDDNYKQLSVKSIILLKSLSTLNNATTKKREIDFTNIFDEGYTSDGSEGTEEGKGETTKRSTSF